MSSDGVAAVEIMQYSTLAKGPRLSLLGTASNFSRLDARNVAPRLCHAESQLWDSVNQSSCTLIELSGTSNDEILRIRFV